MDRRCFWEREEVVGTTSKNERGLRAYGSAQETDFSGELQLLMVKRLRLRFFIQIVRVLHLLFREIQPDFLRRRVFIEH